jgi:hypothetical protein
MRYIVETEDLVAIRYEHVVEAESTGEARDKYDAGDIVEYSQDDAYGEPASSRIIEVRPE